MLKISWAMLACFSFLLVPALVMGQSERGTISGSVKDQSGAVITGARITVTNTGTNVAVVISSGEKGDYSALSLQAGTYTVRIEKPGFRPELVTGVVLNASTDVRADATLEIGTTSTAVEVAAAAIQLSTKMQRRVRQSPISLSMNYRSL